MEKDGVAFVMPFEEEPEWEVAIVFRPIKNSRRKKPSWKNP